MNSKGHNHKMKALSTRLTKFIHEIINGRRMSRADLSKRSSMSGTVNFLHILLDMVEWTKGDEESILDGHIKGVLIVCYREDFRLKEEDRINQDTFVNNKYYLVSPFRTALHSTPSLLVL
jgi:hypothetical protein